MKNIIVFSALLAGSLTIGSAQAATVNVTGTNYDMGTVSVGQYGTVNTNQELVGTTEDLGVAYGYLPADSEITFTYQILGNTGKSEFGNNARLYAYGSYDFTRSGLEHRGNSVDTATNPGTGFGSSVGHITGRGVNALEASPLVLATANIEGTDYGTTTIINTTSSAAYFMSALQELTKFAGKLNVTYAVTAISAVPLPASLPLFACAIATLALLSYRRKVRT